jgi:cystathionine beta-lyase
MAAVTDRLPPDTKWRVGHFGVLASVAAYTEGTPWLDRLLATLDDRRALLGRLLAERLPEVVWQPPEATFLAWLDCSAIGAGAAPRDLFFEKGRVALEPGPRFGAAGSGHVRLNFGTSAEILEEAVDRMAAARGSL